MGRGGRWWWGVIGLTLAAAIGVVAVRTFTATNDGESSADQRLSTTTVMPTDTSSATERWEDAVASFDSGASSSGCTLLQKGNGEVMLDVTLKGTVGETITRRPVSLHPDDYAVSVLLGSGLTGDDSCTTDVPDVSPPSPRRIVTNWPASAASATITITRNDRCAVAVVNLKDVVVTSPTGRAIDLGDVGITNTWWGSWAPFECRLEQR